MDCYIVNLSHTRRDDKFISFWRPEAKGYAFPLPWAGKYSKTQVLAEPDYYNSGDNVAVPCDCFDNMATEPPPGAVDGNVGPVVLSNSKNWKELLLCVIALPRYKPQPMYKGSLSPTKELTI